MFLHLHEVCKVTRYLAKFVKTLRLFVNYTKIVD